MDLSINIIKKIIILITVFKNNKKIHFVNKDNKVQNIGKKDPRMDKYVSSSLNPFFGFKNVTFKKTKVKLFEIIDTWSFFKFEFIVEQYDTVNNYPVFFV